MFAAAYKILCNVEDAEDAVQMAFLKLSNHYGEFRGGAKISTYLHRIVINESLMMLRPKERKAHKIPLECECADSGLISEIPELAVDCRRQYISRINIERAVSHLSANQREVWILYAYLGCGHQEVARTLSSSVSNTKSQLCRARKRLRTILNSKQRPKQKENNNGGFDFYRIVKKLPVKINPGESGNFDHLTAQKFEHPVVDHVVFGIPTVWTSIEAETVFFDRAG